MTSKEKRSEEQWAWMFSQFASLYEMEQKRSNMLLEGLKAVFECCGCPEAEEALKKYEEIGNSSTLSNSDQKHI